MRKLVRNPGKRAAKLNALLREEESASHFDMERALLAYPPSVEKKSAPGTKNRKQSNSVKSGGGSSGRGSVPFTMSETLVSGYSPGVEDILEKESPESPVYFSGKKNRRQRVEKKLDLHGYTVAEARVLLERFLDSARESSLRQVAVIHGKGLHTAPEAGLPGGEESPLISGGALGKSRLRAAVREYLGSAQRKGWVINYYHPEEKYGGIGVSIVILRKK